MRSRPVDGARDADRAHHRLGAGGHEAHLLEARIGSGDALRQLDFRLAGRADRWCRAARLDDRRRRRPDAHGPGSARPRSRRDREAPAVGIDADARPAPRAMNSGVPPTARNARTGEFTPPGNDAAGALEQRDGAGRRFGRAVMMPLGGVKYGDLLAGGMRHCAQRLRSRAGAGVAAAPRERRLRRSRRCACSAAARMPASGRCARRRASVDRKAAHAVPAARASRPCSSSRQQRDRPRRWRCARRQPRSSASCGPMARVASCAAQPREPLVDGGAHRREPQQLRDAPLLRGLDHLVHADARRARCARGVRIDVRRQAEVDQQRAAVGQPRPAFPVPRRPAPPLSHRSLS